MTRRNLLFILLIVLLLAGCTAMPAADQVKDIDLLSLSENVDVDTVAAIKDMDDVLVLDVREQHEYDAKHIPGVTLIPVNTIPDRLDEIPTDQTVIVTCRTGNRSGQVADYLRGSGYTRVHSMSGGIVDWEAAGYPVVTE